MKPVASSNRCIILVEYRSHSFVWKSKVNWDLWFRVNPITTRLCLFPRCHHVYSMWVTALMRPIGRYFVTRTTRDTRLPSLQCFVRLTEYGANPLALWDWQVFYPETYHPIVSWILFSISIRTLGIMRQPRLNVTSFRLRSHWVPTIRGMWTVSAVRGEAYLRLI